MLEQRIWTTVCALIPRSPCGIWLWTLARCCYCSSLINQISNLGRCQIIVRDNEKRVILVELPVKECPLSFLCVLCCYFWDCAQGFWSVCWAPSPPLYPTSLLLSHGRATRTNGFKIEAKLKQEFISALWGLFSVCVKWLFAAGSLDFCDMSMMF